MDGRARVARLKARCGLVPFVASFFVCLSVAVVVGVIGPDRSNFDTATTSTQSCQDPLNCTVALQATFNDLRPLQQYLRLSLSIPLPLNASTGEPVSLASSVDGSVSFYLDVSGGGSEIVSNALHTRSLTWSPGRPSTQASLLRLSPLTVQDLTVAVRVLSPYAAFAAANVSSLSTNTTLSITSRRADEAYSVFELSWRTVFCAGSLALTIAFSVALRRAPRHSAADAPPPGQDAPVLPKALMRRWLWALSVLLVLFNNPAFAAQLIIPTVAAAVFGSIATVTFVSALLLFWLYAFHLSALRPARPAKPGPPTTPTAGVCFWLPKVVVVTLFWVTALTLLLWSRYLSLVDPAARVDESLGALTDYVRGFAFAVLGVYLALLAGTVLLVFCRCRRLRRLDYAFVVLTLATAGIVAAGVFTNAYVAVVDRSAAFLVTFAGANAYVLWLVALYWPPRPDLTASADTEDREAATTGGAAAAAAVRPRSKGGAAATGRGVDTSAIDDGGDDVPIDDVSSARAAGAALAESELAHLSELSDSDEEF